MTLLTTLQPRPRLLHLTVNPAAAVMHRSGSGFGPTLMERIDAQLNRASDWIRYAENCWLFWTDKSAQDWHGIFRENLPEIRAYQYLIVAVDLTDRQGWVPTEVWRWLEKYEQPYRDAAVEAWRSIQRSLEPGKIAFKGQAPAVIQQPKSPVPGVVVVKTEGNKPDKK